MSPHSFSLRGNALHRPMLGVLHLGRGLRASVLAPELSRRVTVPSFFFSPSGDISLPGRVSARLAHCQTSVRWAFTRDTKWTDSATPKTDNSATGTP